MKVPGWRVPVFLLLCLLAFMVLQTSCDEDSSASSEQADGGPGNGDDDDDDNDDENDDDNDDDDDDDDTTSQGRYVLSLNGTWEVEEGQMNDTPPGDFTHSVPVPALLSAASPPFAEVGLNSALREAFWYRRTFEVPVERDVAILNIHKAKYGIDVWLNGKSLGGHLGSYTLASFDVTDALRTDGPNTLLVRVGDYLDSVPAWVPAGQDGEKILWLPGIYDDVEVFLSGSPRIVRVKIEPDIENDTALIITTLQNDHDGPCMVTLAQQAFEESTGAAASGVETDTVQVNAGEEIHVVQSVALEDVNLWSPDNPFLYILRSEVSSGGALLDKLPTRFGMRTVQWRSGPDKGFYLNGRRFFLRGSNITLHRFFEDDHAGTLPWNREWVRRLLSTYPKELQWNAFRMCIGRAPNFWYDLADELGFLLADEFMFWSIIDDRNRYWSLQEMEEQYGEWIRESWNHPSIAWWDASNETIDFKSYLTIGRIRHLDATRQWENGGYGRPHGPDDPIEDHPYRFIFSDFQLENMDWNNGRPPKAFGTRWRPKHPYINNEYGWLWVNRDGTPTMLSEPAYQNLLGPGPHSPEIYREAYAYVVGGLTEFWRSKRGYAGVLHFTYLGYSRPGGATSDNFLDVENLILEPRWLEYAINAFAPLMISIDTWRDEYPPDSMESIPIRVINDDPVPQTATVRLLVVGMEGQVLSESARYPVELEEYGAVDVELSIQTPQSGPFVLAAELDPDDPSLATTWSRRKIGFANVGEPGPSPPFLD